jgi:hypothetical protein
MVLLHVGRCQPPEERRAFLLFSTFLKNRQAPISDRLFPVESLRYFESLRCLGFH